MATNSPEPQPSTLHGAPEDKGKGVPSLFQLIGTAIIIVGAILGGEQLMLSKSLEAMEARLNERAAKSESQLREHIISSVAVLSERVLRSRGVIRPLLFASTLSDLEKQSLSKDLELSVVKEVLHKTSKNEVRKSVESLIQGKKIEKRGDLVKFLGDDRKTRVQIRYFELLDPTLDLSQIDLYSEDVDMCDSRVYYLPGVDGVVQACQSHLDSQGRLEFIVIRNAE